MVYYRMKARRCLMRPQDVVSQAPTAKGREYKSQPQLQIIHISQKKIQFTSPGSYLTHNEVSLTVLWPNEN